MLKEWKKYIFIKKHPYLMVLIVTLALITTSFVLTAILSGNQGQITKEEEGGEINHTKFCIIIKKEEMSINGVEII